MKICTKRWTIKIDRSGGSEDSREVCVLDPTSPEKIVETVFLCYNFI